MQVPTPDATPDLTPARLFCRRCRQDAPVYLEHYWTDSPPLHAEFTTHHRTTPALLCRLCHQCLARGERAVRAAVAGAKLE